jgi:hypothetical protein
VRRLGLIILVQVVRHRARLDRLRSLARNNMPEVAFLASHLPWMTKQQEIVALCDMITSRAAAANLGNYGLKVGCPPISSCSISKASLKCCACTRRPLPPLAMSRWLMPRRRVSSPSLDLADFWPENPPFC